MNDFLKKVTIDLPTSFNQLMVVAYEFDTSKYSSELFQAFNVHYPDSIKKSVPKRQAEFLTGRYAAAIALRLLGKQPSCIPIGKHRSPIWPEGVIASITHTNAIAICAAASSNNYQMIGIDLEKIINEKCVTDIKGTVINSDEEGLLRRCDLSFEDAFTLAFSAKESLFKALYSSVGYYFDFLAAQIIKICFNNNTFTLKLLEDLSSELKKGQEFIGYMHFEEEYVFTFIYLKQLS